ncbi:MAG TPA: EamA family transporter [Candidatus Nanopelagicaceae bacterium]|nr:EamA family transporter [Candidatus Nanopelagicaceae bacterium]
MRARLLVIFSGICFGTTGTAQALGPKGASSLTIGAARLLVGSLLLIAIAAFESKPQKAQIHEVRKRAWLLAGLSMTFYQITFFAGVRATGVAVGTVVALGSAPALTGILSWIFTKHRPTQSWFVATAIAVVGVAIIATAGNESKANPLGVLLALGAGLSYAIFAIVSKDILHSGISTEKAMARIFAIGAVPLLPILFFGDARWIFSQRGMVLALWLGLVPTALAYLAYGAGLRHIQANEATTLTLAEPITATILGTLVVHQHPATMAWVGVGLIFVGLIALKVRNDQVPDYRSFPA